MPYEPKFKRVADCGPGELVRMRFGNETVWTIICKKQSRLVHMAALLSATRGVRTINMLEDGQLRHDFATIPALSYGNDYEIQRDHSGPMVIVRDEFVRTPGLIVQTLEDFYLIAEGDDRRAVYLAWRGGRIQSEPGGARALYGRWRLTHSEIRINGIRTPLLEFETEVTEE